MSGAPLEAYLAERKEQDDKKIADLEARLDFEARSDALHHKRHLQRLLDVWPHALTEMRVVEALGLTPLQYVARYGDDKLNRFVASYMGPGSGAQTALEAGYGVKKSSAGSAANLLLQMPVVAAAIRERMREGITGRILTLQELQVLWSRDALLAESSRERHQAREALAKTFGAFVTKSETTLQGGEKPVRMEHKMPDSVARLLDEHLGQ